MITIILIATMAVVRFSDQLISSPFCHYLFMSPWLALIPPLAQGDFPLAKVKEGLVTQVIRRTKDIHASTGMTNSAYFGTEWGILRL